jgi:glycosyltransferase involved in cell wall biosynthesis
MVDGTYGMGELMTPILIVDLAKRYGGAEVRVFDTAKALHGKYPYAVAVLTNSPLHQRLEAAGLTTLPTPYVRSDPRQLLFFRQAIRQKGYKIVDAHNVQSQFWGHLAALTAGAGRVSTVHSAYKIEHNYSLKGRLYEQVLRFNLWWGAKFIVVSEAVYSYLQSAGIPPGKISLIHNSFYPPPDPLPGKNHPLLKSLGWDKDIYVIIVVARLEPVKGHTFLLDALKQIEKEHPQIRCLIVGEGRTRGDIETQIRQNNLGKRVHLTGFRDDIPALLSASDAFCLPSLSEGLPYALLEACGQQLPLLVTAVGGMAEFLVHRQTAYLTPPSNPPALADGLRWLLAHPQQATAMGQAAFDDVRRRFNPVDMLEKTLTVYHRK